MTQDISNTADVIDVRDIIARVEELEGERDAFEPEGAQDERWSVTYPEAGEELAHLSTLLEDLKGNGGDEQWRGDWYPVTLVRDSYFVTFAQQFADDIGAVPDDASWPCTCIDWEQAARELRMDYTCVEYDGVTYWIR